MANIQTEKSTGRTKDDAYFQMPITSKYCDWISALHGFLITKKNSIQSVISKNNFESPIFFSFCKQRSGNIGNTVTEMVNMNNLALNKRVALNGFG